MASAQASYPTIPPQTLNFVRTLPDARLLRILSSAKVNLRASRGGKLLRGELERRVKLMLSDCQRLKDVFPLGQVSYSDLPEWTEHDAHDDVDDDDDVDNVIGDGTQADKSNFGRRRVLTDAFINIYSLKESLVLRELHNSISGLVDHEEGEHAFVDAGESLAGFAGRVRDMLLFGSFETTPFMFEDEAESSVIVVKVVSVRSCPSDPQHPILFVMFYHDTRGHLAEVSPVVDVTDASPSARWIKACFRDPGFVGAVKISCPLDAQQLILRQLIYNARRLPAGSKSAFSESRAGPLLHFMPSFILPLRPISPSTLGHLSRPLKVSDCSAAACPGLFSDTFVCSRCHLARYCSQSCQSCDHRKHASLCGRISASEIVSFDACPPADTPQYAVFCSTGMSISDMRAPRPHLTQTEAIKSGFIESRKKRPGQMPFLIKVQVPAGQPGGGALMIYDQDRTFTSLLYPPQEGTDTRDALAYGKLERLGKNCTRWRGLKVFLYARHSGNEDDTRLEVLTSVLPGQEVVW